MKRQAIRCLTSAVYATGILTVLASPAWGTDRQSSALQGDLEIGGTGAALGTIQKLADEFVKIHPGVHVKVLPSLGSGGGIKALMAGKLTVSVSSRALTDAERAKGLSATEISRTPFVFATHAKTPVTNVSLDDLAGLYSGKTAAWSNGTPVRPILRPPTDVDTQVVKDMSAALNQAVTDAHQRPGTNVAVTDTDSADELEKISGSIGTSTLALIQSENRQLKVLSVGGVEPTLENAVRKKYPYLKSIYMIMPATTSPMAQAFARFTDSPAGKAIMTQTGNIPLASEK